MKELMMTLLAVLLIAGLSAFEEGTFIIGGSASYEVSRLNEDASSITQYTFSPEFGYFVADNLSADLLLEIVHARQGRQRETNLAFGLGGRLFVNRFYGGLAFVQRGYEFTSGLFYTHEYSAYYYYANAGYLVELAENVFVDLGLTYGGGIGKYGGDVAGDNEWRGLQLRTGLQFFF